LTAAGTPGLTFTLTATAPLVPLGWAGHLRLIPCLGALGASLVTTLFANLGALAAVLAVYRLWQILLSLGRLRRSLLLSGVAFALATFWSAPRALLFLKLPAIGLMTGLAFLVLGEFRASEIALACSSVRWRTPPKHVPSKV